jgi:ectoine hydroxylase-related dioxygenase (phytanoyl-CoA dioxygenase family)
MVEIVHVDLRSDSCEAIVAVLDRDGTVIIDDVLATDQVGAILTELQPFIDGTAPFPDDFIGRRTTRTGALVARSKTARQAVTQPGVLAVAGAVLERSSANFQLSATQIMRLLPGESAQQLHRDRYLWSRSLPHEIEPMVNCIWALTDFTEANGATRVIPTSQRWDWDRGGTHEESAPAEMSCGSVLLYTGSVVHGAGENRTDAPRVGMYIQYLLAWLRQEENQYLSCPPHVARELDPELQGLLGYTVGNGSLGYFSALEAPDGTIDALPPEAAVGRFAEYADQQPF